MSPRSFSKAVAALVIALCAGAAFAASDFVGKYKTMDTQGKEMTFALTEDGSATGQRANEGLKGTWKEEDGAVLINWGNGWTTRLTKEGDKYHTAAFKEGKPFKDVRGAEKVE